MNPKLESAVEALQEELQTKIQEVAETKKMINQLLRRMGKEALYTDIDTEDNFGPMRPDAFYGKPISTAARLFLERRKTACAPEEIMKGMEAGGFDFKAMGWKENDRLRSLAVTLGKNNSIFHRLPNGTIGLLDWYPTVANKKEKVEKGPDENSEIQQEEKAEE